jgi:hypothetical protein
MSNNITGFYRSVLDLPKVDPTMQRQILRHGSRRGDHGLLAQLAARPDLEIGLDKELGTIDAAVVKVAWASRPERTEADLVELVRTEKRIKVLAALAARDDLPVALYTAIANHGRGGALEALLLNTKVDIDVKLVAAQRYAVESRGVRVSHSLNSVLSQEPQVTEIMARYTKNYYLAAAATSIQTSEFTAETYANVVKLAMQRLNDQTDAPKYETVNEMEAIGTAVSEDSDRDEQLVASFITALRETGVRLTGSWLKDRFTDLAGKLEKSAPLSATKIDLVAAARDARTEQDVIKLITLFATNSSSMRGAALVAAAKNDNIDATALVEVLRSANYGWYVLREVMWAFPRISAEKAAALIMSWSYMADDALIARHPEPTAVLMHTAQLACRFDTVPQILLTSRFITNEAIDAMPFSVFMRTEGVSIAVTQRVAEHISASLGDDDQVWETLHALAPDFTGSIAELVEVVSKV